MDVRDFIGRNIRRIRIERDLKQAHVASELDVDRAYISSLERGERNATVVTLWHIARILGVEFAELFQTPAGEEGPTTALKAREIDKKT